MCGTCGCESSMVVHHHESRPDKGSAIPHNKTYRKVVLEKNILDKNDAYASKNRSFCLSNQILSLNLVSSPGSGKTSLLVETINALKPHFPINVIEGDQHTSNDADKIRATGVKAIQINTGKGCHLEAHGIGHAINDLEPRPQSLLFIENVGNLVCPAEFDLGEQAKVVILSVTEGEDKPLKYPHMFRAASLLIINKIDLLPYVDFDVDECLRFARQVNPSIKALCLSVKTGEGMPQWCDWVTEQQSMLSKGAA
ncbi:MAG: hydrogenase nickel incorporation protein HypB [Pseudomonadales bacterium]|nr:hydrogenase nickel incorporation protein HypB [Pseudomonadales bacterium]PCI06766.1 MAG: hydrogenase accessory protein HypB [Gammaproteobacteria bacterium]